MFDDLMRLNGWQRISTDIQTKWLVLRAGISVNMIQLTMQIMEQNGANSSASGSSVKSYLRGLESYNTLNVNMSVFGISVKSYPPSPGSYENNQMPSFQRSVFH